MPDPGGLTTRGCPLSFARGSDFGADDESIEVAVRC